jgi:hypothetical protein
LLAMSPASRRRSDSLPQSMKIRRVLEDVVLLELLLLPLLEVADEVGEETEREISVHERHAEILLRIQWDIAERALTTS